MKKTIIYSLIIFAILIIIILFSLWGPYWVHLYIPCLNIGNRVRVRDYSGRNSASIRARFFLTDALYDEEFYTLWIGSHDNEKYIKKYPYGTDAIKLKWADYVHDNNVLFVYYRFSARYYTDTLKVNDIAK